MCSDMWNFKLKQTNKQKKLSQNQVTNSAGEAVEVQVANPDGGDKGVLQT